VFYPVAIETAGTWHFRAIELVEEIGKRTINITGDPNETESKRAGILGALDSIFARLPTVFRQIEHGLQAENLIPNLLCQPTADMRFRIRRPSCLEFRLFPENLRKLTSIRRCF